MTALPFISHMARSPVVVFVQNRSALPSPLKSPVPLIFQAGGTVPTLAPPPAALPFMNHIERSPVAVFDQKMSALPSPLKSPATEPAGMPPTRGIEVSSPASEKMRVRRSSEKVIVMAPSGSERPHSPLVSTFGVAVITPVSAFHV